MEFYLGTHMPNWLEVAEVPLFISRRRLARYKRLFVPRARWALDSGGFTELSTNGQWSITPRRYAGEVMRYQADMGMMQFAAIQDYMCEPFVLAKTGLTIREHIRRTVHSFIELSNIAPSVPWLPVLQGYTYDDYLRCMCYYDECGIDLSVCDRVGLGSVCRRQGTKEIETIVKCLSAFGLKLHGFGIKTKGLRQLAGHLASADSMAWSFDARYAARLYGHKHANCANCIDYALMWRENLLCQLNG